MLSMIGIVALGSKQYKIVPGEACIFEKIEGEEGSNIQLKNLVMLSDNDDVILDEERLRRYKVNGEIIKQYREDKVISFKKKRRKDYTNKRGHRQYKTLVLIKSIELNS